MNETELAAAVASGAVPSPARCAGFWLVALRITGTGTAFRSALDEHVYRPPENYLTPEFLARCNGLPIIANHQEGTLDGAEYEARALGSIVLPYIANADGIEDAAGDEVWGVGRVYLDEVVQALSDPNSPLSTSPCVVFRPADGNEKVEMADGSTVLIEGKPSLLCSVAICNGQGVWDKSLPAHGIRVDSQTGKVNTVTNEEMEADKARKDAEEKARKDAETATNIDKILQHLNDGAKKLDAVCSRLDALEKGGAKQELLEEPGKKTDAELDREREESYCNADAQARADSVYQSFGNRAPMPMQGEKTINYRRRLLRPLQRHSNEFKDANLEILAAHEKTFNAIEGRIYADAVAASRNPQHPEGFIEKRTRTLESGHKVTEFYGSPTIFKQFTPPAKCATKFLTPQLLGENR